MDSKAANLNLKADNDGWEEAADWYVDARGNVIVVEQDNGGLEDSGEP